MRKRYSLLHALVLTTCAIATITYAEGISPVAASATVFIAKYDDQDRLIGWGSGFYVDEGIVVTNKHVIEGSAWYRVFATDDKQQVNQDCFQRISKADVKINLDDDVAYMRAYVPCDHGVMNFTEDPVMGDPVEVIGFPYRGSVEASLQEKVTSGSVIGRTTDGWLLTDAKLDFGNSGGPVVKGAEVLGVAVAKSVDEQGNYLVGYFIPSSVILKGLLYANDSWFGYVPRNLPASPRSSSSSSASSASRASSSSVSSRGHTAPPVSSTHTWQSPLQIRTCNRVMQEFQTNKVMLKRVNDRLKKRFGFVCS